MGGQARPRRIGAQLEHEGQVGRVDDIARVVIALQPVEDAGMIAPDNAERGGKDGLKRGHGYGPGGAGDRAAHLPRE